MRFPRKSSIRGINTIPKQLHKAKLQWVEEFDGDYLHFCAAPVGHYPFPAYWLCDLDGGDGLYSVRLVHANDDDEIIVGTKAPVSLIEAKAIAERHYAEST